MTGADQGARELEGKSGVNLRQAQAKKKLTTMRIGSTDFRLNDPFHKDYFLFLDRFFPTY